MQRINSDPANMFKYELCGYPASLFVCSKLLRPADKPPLPDKLWKLVNQISNFSLPSQYYVLDDGSLLHRIPWKKGMSYLSILNLYVNYVKEHYKNASIVFDG